MTWSESQLDIGLVKAFQALFAEHAACPWVQRGRCVWCATPRRAPLPRRLPRGKATSPKADP